MAMKPVSRRTFLKSTGGLTVAGALAGGSASLLAACQSLSGTASSGTGAKRFDGVTVTVISQAGGPIASAYEKLGGPWQESTGAKINLVTFPFADVFSKIRSAALAGEYLGDLYNISALWGGDLMGGGYLEPVPDEVRAELDLDDIVPAYRQYLSWGGELYATPLDGDCTMMDYRKDVLSNPAHQSKFKTEYGYDLPVPPKTWKEFLDVSKFFTGWDWSGTGKPGYGEAIAMIRGGTSYWVFNTHAAAYSKYPGDPAYFFDPETMKPLINNPGFVRALEEWKQEATYGPPGMVTQSQGDIRASYISGGAVFTYEFGDIGTLSIDPNTSAVKDKLGFAVAPGSTEVYNRKTGAWETFDEVQYAPYLAFGGWLQVVPKDSKQKEAAWDLARFMGTQPVQLQAAVLPNSGVNPSRLSTLSDVQPWVDAGFDEPSAEEYLTAIEGTISSPNALLDMRIPGQPDYQDALEVQLSRVLAGEVDAQEGLDIAANDWEVITERLGREQQRALYNDSLKES